MIVFDDVIENVLSNKKFNPIVTELFRKLSISFGFITKSYFAVSKNIRPHYKHYENSKQTRTSTNRIKSFIRYWLSRL